MFFSGFVFEQPRPVQPAACGCGLRLHLSEDRAVTHEVFSHGFFLSQQSSVAPHSHNLPQVGISIPSSLYQAVFMLPYLFFFFVRGHLNGRIFKINIYIHLFLAVLDPLVAVSESYSPAATCRLFTVVASLGADHRL